MNDKIIELALHQKKINNIRTPTDLVIDVSDDIIEEILMIMFKSGYNIQDNDFIRDLTVVRVLFEASLHRLSKIEDDNIKILDEWKQID